MTPLRKINEIPVTLNIGAIDRAIQAFLEDSHVDEVPINLPGLRQQITDAIASVVVFKNNPAAHFWLAEDEGEVMAWALCHMSKDVDGQLCYWATDAWISKKVRGLQIAKQWFQQIREEAKKQMCKHILIPSSRGSKAYCRFLGKGWHEYLVILKEDI